MKSQLVILDFGSQYTQLIARTVRELGVYCQIIPGTAAFSKISELDPDALILSGGPASVGAENAPKVDPKVLHMGLPVFGICYGMQLLAGDSDKVEESSIREFGAATINFSNPVGPFSCFAEKTKQDVWMSHGDKVTELPPSFVQVASSSGSPIAAFANEEQRFFGVQFHPEVHHTPGGKELLSKFLFDVAKLKKDWDPKCFVSDTVAGVEKKVPIFDDEASRISDVEYLVQGTLYPDVIESVSVIGNSATIKSHHNVGGLIDNMKLGLIEPLRELFKDEVRKIGRQMEIPEPLIARQPFPGPGLAVRCIGELTPPRLAKLRCADKIVRQEVESAGLNEVIWQSFAVLLPVQSVGVMGDGRTFEECIAIRAITSRDGMTADWYYFEEEILRKMSSRIVNETDGVNRVVLDVSSKPPATIEWE
ncbi:UNVERIFIED_CONTAM: hypothetical protein GTU68_030938 [Idotea baltica]|nr:hypothetical protein [Idotea baltica]